MSAAGQRHSANETRISNIHRLCRSDEASGNTASHPPRIVSNDSALPVNGGVEHATEVGAGDGAAVHADADEATPELVHDHEPSTS